MKMYSPGDPSRRCETGAIGYQRKKKEMRQQIRGIPDSRMQRKGVVEIEVQVCFYFKIS